MSQRQSAHQKIKEQELEITALKASLYSLEARTSHLHVRLLTTLDTLDSQQSSHASDLETLQLETRTLEDRLRIQQNELAKAVQERDELKDAVETLIEKVELANGYHFLSHSAIHANFLLGEQFSPLKSSNSFSVTQTLRYDVAGLFSEPAPASASNPELPTLYMPAILKTLSADLALERNEHDRTRVEARAQITSLRAQLARREAELESYVLLGENASTGGPSRPRPQQTLPKLSKEQALAILGHASDRNRVLQREVEELGKQLNEAHITSSSAAAKVTLPQDEDSNEAFSTPIRPPVISIHAPSTPTRSLAGSPSPQVSDVFSGGDSSRLSSHLPSVSRIPSVFLPPTPPAPKKIESPRSAPSSLVGRVFDDIDRQISNFDVQAQELRVEREHLDQSNRTNDATVSNSAIEMESILLLEEECIRLRDAARQSEQEARQARAELLQREEALREIIAGLQEELRNGHHHSDNPDISSIFDSEDGSLLETMGSQANVPYVGDSSTEDYRTMETENETEVPATPRASVEPSLTQDSDTSSNYWGPAQLSDTNDNLEETLRLAREELQQKSDEIRYLRQEMARHRFEPRSHPSSQSQAVLHHSA